MFWQTVGARKRDACALQTCLRMVRFFSQECVQERFTGWLLAAAVRFDGDEDGVNFRKLLGIVEA